MSKYGSIIASIFAEKYEERMEEVPFTREDLISHAHKLGITPPKNLGDVVYSFRYRADLPTSIARTAPTGYTWIIVGTGDARYSFLKSRQSNIQPNSALLPILVPQSTPEILSLYSLSDEQSLLSKVRYNKILDLFLGIVTYSMQNHLRTKVEGIGQIEIDELYIGVNKIGQQFIIPVQAKAGNDKIGVVQLYQDITFCRTKFPDLICVPIAVHFSEADSRICMFRLALDHFSVAIVEEKHYRLAQSFAFYDGYVRNVNAENAPLLID
ncbi:MAG: endonuclease [Clostridia bacterium]|nr:endonuclease [Clostridia bacterium]